MGFLIGGRRAACSRSSAPTTSTSAIARRRRDGELLVLERRFSWTRGLAMRIRSVPLAAIKPGALVDGPELIFADMG